MFLVLLFSCFPPTAYYQYSNQRKKLICWIILLFCSKIHCSLCCQYQMITKNNLIPLAVLSSQFYKWSNKAGKDPFLDSRYLGKSGNIQFEARESFWRIYAFNHDVLSCSGRNLRSPNCTAPILFLPPTEFSSFISF